jgi:hypothetical protein
MNRGARMPNFEAVKSQLFWKPVVDRLLRFESEPLNDDQVVHLRDIVSIYEKAIGDGRLKFKTKKRTDTMPSVRSCVDMIRELTTSCMDDDEIRKALTEVLFHIEQLETNKDSVERETEIRSDQQLCENVGKMYPDYAEIVRTLPYSIMRKLLSKIWISRIRDDILSENFVDEASEALGRLVIVSRKTSKYRHPLDEFGPGKEEGNPELADIRIAAYQLNEKVYDFHKNQLEHWTKTRTAIGREIWYLFDLAIRQLLFKGFDEWNTAKKFALEASEFNPSELLPLIVGMDHSEIKGSLTIRIEQFELLNALIDQFVADHEYEHHVDMSGASVRLRDPVEVIVPEKLNHTQTVSKNEFKKSPIAYIRSGFLCLKLDLSFDKKTLKNAIDDLVDYAQEANGKIGTERTLWKYQIFESLFTHFYRKTRSKEEALKLVSRYFEQQHGMDLGIHALKIRYLKRYKEKLGIHSVKELLRNS